MRVKGILSFILFLIATLVVPIALFYVHPVAPLVYGGVVLTILLVGSWDYIS